MKPANQKAPGSNRDMDIYEAYVRRCLAMGIPEKSIATQQKYFDINRTASRGGL